MYPRNHYSYQECDDSEYEESPYASDDGQYNSYDDYGGGRYCESGEEFSDYEDGQYCYDREDEGTDYEESDESENEVLTRDKRVFGFYRCRQCKGTWQSAYTWIKAYTMEFYTQECKRCKISLQPYRYEELLCQQCLQKPCACGKSRKRPHRSDLCERCKTGRLCQQETDCSC